MVVKRALSALSKIGIIIAIAVAFIFGLGGTIYLSLRSPEVKVPDVKGQNRATAESALDDKGLHMRVRATRFSPDAQPDTILDQSPQKDEIIKVGQTVAVVVSRGAKEGEHAASTSGVDAEKKTETGNAASNQNTRETWETSTENENQNQNKPKTNKNANNKNANNSNNANNANGNRNANNRNAAGGNANNRNVNTAEPNVNRSAGNSNANKRPTVPTTPPFVPSRPPGTTP
jgi:beta-lactam-binding protein with PASTA domain